MYTVGLNKHIRMTPIFSLEGKILCELMKNVVDLYLPNQQLPSMGVSIDFCLRLQKYTNKINI